jgi:hypothetical protein
MTDFRYSQSEFNTLLSQFQSAIDCGEYTEKISYDTWRKLKKLTGPIVIEYESPFVKISYEFREYDGSVSRQIVYSAKIYDWGFGRFFYDYVVKKENERMNLSTKATSATAYSVAETAKIVGDPIMSINGTIDIGYDLDSSTSISNYGTTTDNTRLNADQLVYNGYADKISTDHYANSWIGITDTKVDKTEFDALQRKVEEHLKKENKNKCEENNTMMKGINFDFGPCGNTVRLSMYGMAIQNISGEWVSYNPDSREIINVDVFNMADGGKYMYKMPVAIADVKEGDIVIHNRVPMFVTAINENGTFEVTDVRAGETKNIIPTRNMFGFNFMTKVVSMFGTFTDAPTADQPFGNMLPFLMMGDENGKDIDPVMLMFMMNQSGNNGMNPMMWYFMFKDNKDIDPAMMWMITSMVAGSAPSFMTGNYPRGTAIPDVQK